VKTGTKSAQIIKMTKMTKFCAAKVHKKEDLFYAIRRKNLEY